MFDEDIIMNLVEALHLHKVSLKAILNMLSISNEDCTRFLAYLLKEHRFYYHILKAEPHFLQNCHLDIDVYSLILYRIRKYLIKC